MLRLIWILKMVRTKGASKTVFKYKTIINIHILTIDLKKCFCLKDIEPGPSKVENNLIQCA